MYQYYNDLFSLGCATADFQPEETLYALPPPAPAPPNSSLPPPRNMPIDHHRDHQQLVLLDFDSSVDLVGLKSEFMSYTSSSSSSYGSPTSSSLPTNYLVAHHDQTPTTTTNLVQRSMSTNSIISVQKHHPNSNSNCLSSYLNNNNPVFSSFLDVSSSSLCWDSHTFPIRKVFSTGDLQHNNLSQSPLLHENCTMEGMNKVRRYSAEERKERIERYRAKRHQRNFNKKIKYACRKTLADSRPRIRGRFARNEEIEESAQAQWYQMSKEESEEDGDVWLNFLEAFSVNLANPLKISN